MVFLLNIACSFFAILITSLTSAMPDVVADSCTKRVAAELFVWAAMILAKVVCINRSYLSAENDIVNHLYDCNLLVDT